MEQRIMIIRIIFILLALWSLSLTGCANPAILQKCPAYFQKNIGEVKQQPLNPLGLIFRGLVQTTDPDGTIYLYLLADNNVLLEESFHSFEIRAGHSRYAEWERFYLDFHNGNVDAYKDYGGAKLSLLTWACWPFLNGQYHRVSHFEHTAYCFTELMAGAKAEGAKLDAVQRFINGGYR